MPSHHPNPHELLRGVSRSFYLSIQWLPAAVRGPTGLAYLLARITDTVADNAELSAQQRLALLSSLQLALQEPHNAASIGPALHACALHVPDPHEQQLLRHGQACLQALHDLPATDQGLIGEVLAAITEGQCWDLSALDGAGQGVKTCAEIERYTWWVAGSVGEFWTKICALHLHDWHSAPQRDLLVWGAAYGQGLQRLNILRDAGRDLRAGRCYWPAEELQALDLDASRLITAVRAGDLTTLVRLQPLLQAWHQQTEDLLHAGLRYSLALRPWRLRLASALPCLIGIQTLSLLRQAGPQALLAHTKLPRRAVHWLLCRLLLSGVSRQQLQACWNSALRTTDRP